MVSEAKRLCSRLGWVDGFAKTLLCIASQPLRHFADTSGPLATAQLVNVRLYTQPGLLPTVYALTAMLLASPGQFWQLD